jgi:hypothetical protein
LHVPLHFLLFLQFFVDFSFHEFEIVTSETVGNEGVAADEPEAENGEGAPYLESLLAREHLRALIYRVQMALDGTRGRLRVSLVVHLMSLEVDLGYVVHDLATFLAATEKPLQSGLILLWLLSLLLLLNV